MAAGDDLFAIAEKHEDEPSVLALVGVTISQRRKLAGGARSKSTAQQRGSTQDTHTHNNEFYCDSRSVGVSLIRLISELQQ